jgi:hypothetical protein
MRDDALLGVRVLSLAVNGTTGVSRIAVAFANTKDIIIINNNIIMIIPLLVCTFGSAPN